MNRRAFIASLGATVVGAHAFAQERDRRITVGIEARHLYRSEIPVRARPVKSGKEPLLVRIDSETKDGGAIIYDLRAVAFVPGVHDLRTALERADGGPIDALPSANIEVFGVLPKGHRGVEPVADPDAPRLGGYRTALIIAGVCWIAPLAFVIARRVLKRSAKRVETAQVAPPALADQLRPLVEAAIAGRASVEERARLERLLLAHWREKLSLGACSAREALAAMKAHEEAGAILRAIEAWLHMPRRPNEANPDIGALLAPYGAAPRVEIGAAQELELKPARVPATDDEGGRR